MRTQWTTMIGICLGAAVLMPSQSAAQGAKKEVYSDAPLSVGQLEQLFGVSATQDPSKLKFRAGVEFGNSGDADTATAPVAGAAGHPAAAGAASVSYPIEFDVNSARMQPSGVDSIQSMAEFLKKYPSLTILVVGHTDSSGNPAANLVLSEHRAKTVRAELIKAGVGAQQVATVGRGQSAPLPDVPANSPRNRRVEFVGMSQ